MNVKLEDIKIQELTDGFRHDEITGRYACIFCGTIFEEGSIYEIDGSLADAHKAVKLHVEKKHGAVFNMLLAEDRRFTGLTDVQKGFLAGFYNGLPDKAIAKATGTSQATVRYQRFSFREKAKQAKIILALSELLEARLTGCEFPQIPDNAPVIDERYMTADEETDKVINTFFISFDPLQLKSFPTKQKNKLIILKVVASQFEPSKIYTEKQVNEIIKPIYFDIETIRRYLIEYGFMGRKPDGSEYWLNSLL